MRTTGGRGASFHESERLAREYARDKLGFEQATVRPATAAEQLKALKETGVDLEAARDVVVVADPTTGRSALLSLDLDPALSRHLNAESSAVTFLGLALSVAGALVVPGVGALAGVGLVALLGGKDIVKAGVPMLKARLKGEATDPRQRALLRMGLKHMALAGLGGGVHALGHAAVAAKGVAHGVHAAKAAHGAHGIAHAAHLGHQATEVALGAKDSLESVEKKSVGAVLKAAWHGLLGAIGVHHPEHHGQNDARIVVVEMKGAAADAADGKGRPPVDDTPPKATSPPG